MCWGYITGKLSSSPLHLNVNPYLLLFLAALPDVDLLLGVFGIHHRTWTHSILIWSVAFTPFFIKYKRNTIPYFVAVISHIILGDAIVGRINPIWPIGKFNFSLGYGLLSIENIVLEAVGLAIFLFWAFKSKEARTSFFGKSRRNLWSILSILTLGGFILFTYSFNTTSDAFEEYGILKPSRLIDSTPLITAHQLFPIELAMHLILLVFLSVCLIQGLRTQSREPTLKS